MWRDALNLEGHVVLCKLGLTGRKHEVYWTPGPLSVAGLALFNIAIATLPIGSHFRSLTWYNPWKLDEAVGEDSGVGSCSRLISES